MTGGEMVAILVVVLVVMGGLFTLVLYWLIELCAEHGVKLERAWERATHVQNEAWLRAIEERKVSRDQLAISNQWLVEIAKATRPHARVEEVAFMKELKGEVSVMLNRAQLMIGLTKDPVDHNAETQETPGVVVSGNGLRG